MTNTWIAVDNEGTITEASTTNPELITSEDVPDYQYEFDLTWEQIEELWKYKVVDGNLILK